MTFLCFYILFYASGKHILLKKIQIYIYLLFQTPNNVSAASIEPGLQQEQTTAGIGPEQPQN